MSQILIELKGLLTHDQEKTYVHLPFSMPGGALSLEVNYHYSDRIGSDPSLSGGNTIDLGVFDERGIEFIKAGFRGWSGSERERFSITACHATPGYLPGALNPGLWHILLGLYKIAPKGCEYQVSIAISTSDGYVPLAQPTNGFGNDLLTSVAVTRSTSWLRGELHCHSIHSDGVLLPQELVELACSRGLDFLAISDHNSTSSQRDLEKLARSGLILLRGMEVTTFKGHFNAWGIPQWIDFRVQQPEDMRDVLQFAHQRGAVTSCNHPKPYGPDWDYPEVSDHTCVEVWNGPWSGVNEIALNYWLSLLAAGRHMNAVGGSDYHHAQDGEGKVMREVGTPTNWVYVPGTADAGGILHALSLGHVSLSAEPDGPFLEMRGGSEFRLLGGDHVEVIPSGGLALRVICQHGSGCHLRLLDQAGVLFEKEVRGAQQSFVWTLPAVELSDRDSRYVRAEMRDSEGRMRALTNPIYLPGKWRAAIPGWFT